MESNTKILRRMLNERGVEWGDIDTGGKRSLITLWHGAGGMEWQFYENTKTNWTLLRSRRDYLTPEQAIAATLGRGTCHNSAPSYLDFLCSECGFVHYHSDENDSGEGNEWRHCPNCGAKVVDDG